MKGSINGLLLRRSLSYAIERKRMAEQLHHLAHHDALTGLANRKLFYDRLQRSINAARRSGKRAVLMFLDLTGFKAINDSLGHQVGDLLLQGVSQRLTDCVRASDCVARLGGDEFTVLLDDVSGPEDILPIAQKILGALSEPFTLESAHLVTHASLGVALFPDDSDDAASLVRAADAAMYQAKQPPPTTAASASSPRNWPPKRKVTRTTPGAWARPSSKANSSCTISRKWTSAAARSSAWKRCCAGSTRKKGC
ncbi:GGDEF domain-containing protein [Methylogaea oryzae]|uniref:GGDEF domain-containing protein n=1 Tax=Methylogaea oryzae TaxID=1295382 RepID=UPI0006D0ABC5|nr:GGDEF domain-containing protein [Methylogaea oryzae]